MNRYLLPLAVALAIGGVVYEVSVPTAPIPVLLDAGMGECVPRLISCPVRLSEAAVAKALDGGLLLARPGQRYVRASTLAYDCSAQDAGLVVPILAAFGVTQSGDPNLQVVQRDRCELRDCDATCAAKFPLRFDQPPCRRQPLDGGACLRVDGGDPGAGNVYPASELAGAACEAVECSVYAGDSPDEAL